MTRRTRILLSLLAVAGIGACGYVAWQASRSQPRLDELRAAARKNPQDVASRLELAKLLLEIARQNGLQAAQYDETLLTSPESLMSPASVARQKDINALRTRVAADVEEATAALAKAVEIAPEQPAPHLAIVQLYLATGNFKKARLSVDLARFSCKFSPAEAAFLRESATIAALNQGDIRGAEDEARKLLAADASNSIGSLALARGDWVRQDTAAADEKIARVLAKPTGDNPYVLEMLGSLLRDRNRAAESLPVLEKAVALTPDRIFFRHSLALTYLRLGRATDSLQQYLLIKQLDKRDALAYVGIAQVYHLSRNDRQAKEFLGVAALVSNNNPQILGRYARFLATSGDPAVKDLIMANEYVERAIEASGGEDVELFRLQARISADRGLFEGALDACNRALNLAQKNGQTKAAAEIRRELANYAISKRYPAEEFDIFNYVTGSTAADLGPDLLPINAVPPSTRP